MPVSRTLIYGGLAAISIGLFVWSAPDDEAATLKAKPKSKAAKSVDLVAEMIAAEKDKHFDKPSGTLRNCFEPLYKGAHAESVAAAGEEDLTKVPAKLAGDGNWAFTGMAEVDGKPIAALENLTSHQSGFLEVGETWKKSKVLKITSSSITLLDDKGNEQTVLRYNPNDVPKPKAAPEPGFKPLEFGALRGNIGPSIEISPEAPPRSRLLHKP